MMKVKWKNELSITNSIYIWTWKKEEYEKLCMLQNISLPISNGLWSTSLSYKLF